MNYDFDIVTLHRAENYGAALQAYALKNYLCGLGYRVGIYDAEQIPAPRNTSPRGRLIGLAKGTANFFNRKHIKIRSTKFKTFAEEYFEINRCNSAKAYIAGSDQVWNPIVFNPYYYLDFVPENSVRASYAASIGVTELPDSTKNQYREYLLKFDYISVREVSAKVAIGKFIPEKNIRVDLDPTFLLTKQEWEKLSYKGTNNIKGDYILLYILHIPENINELCRWLKKELDAEIVLIDGDGYLGMKIAHDKTIKDAGPEDFLALIRDAKAVVTSSFHGTAFSILFEKEFYSVLNADFPGRVANILNYFELFPILSNQKSFSRQRADYYRIRNKLEENRRNSEAYFNSIQESYGQKNNE